MNYNQLSKIATQIALLDVRTSYYKRNEVIEVTYITLKCKISDLFMLFINLFDNSYQIYNVK